MLDLTSLRTLKRYFYNYKVSEFYERSRKKCKNVKFNKQKTAPKRGFF